MATALPFIMAGVSVVQGIQGYQQNNAMAKASPKTVVTVVLEVGARFSGQASVSTRMLK